MARIDADSTYTAFGTTSEIMNVCYARKFSLCFFTQSFKISYVLQKYVE